MDKDFHVEVARIIRAERQRLEYLAASILVLRVRDGVPVSSEMARERANNIAQALLLLGVLRVRS